MTRSQFTRSLARFFPTLLLLLSCRLAGGGSAPASASAAGAAVASAHWRVAIVCVCVRLRVVSCIAPPNCADSATRKLTSSSQLAWRLPLSRREAGSAATGSASPLSQQPPPPPLQTASPTETISLTCVYTLARYCLSRSSRRRSAGKSFNLTDRSESLSVCERRPAAYRRAGGLTPTCPLQARPAASAAGGRQLNGPQLALANSSGESAGQTEAV